ncbi:uncharacterized protein, partial [Halyomorpha halys]|uniref:uncharacterized protein n=1 Tax=Halyomorpha halys TaxID=286706 RepID=UPI0006D4C832
MNIDSIFNNGLDEVLCVIRDLPGYSPAKLKQEEFKIARYKIEYILFSFQDYIKSLPAPGVSLSASNRILIYNARCILEGISIVFNVQIDCIQRLYSNYLKYREKQLVSDPYNRADITKPRAKTGKTRKFPRISDVIETHDHEELEQIIDNIGVDLVEKTTRHKKVKKTFRDKPVMTSEEYAKFLDRKKSM